MFHPPLEPDLCLKDRKPDLYSVSDVEASDWTGFLVMGHYDKYSKKFRYFIKMDDYFNFIFSKENITDIVYFHNGGRYDFQFIFEDVVGNPLYKIDDFVPRGASILSFKLSRVEETINKNRTNKWVWTNDEGDEEVIKPKRIISEDDGVCRFRARTIQYRDSLAILPFSLDTLCKNFKVEHKKKKIDYDYITSHGAEIAEFYKVDAGLLSLKNSKILNSSNFEAIKKFSLEMIEYLEYDVKGLDEVIVKYQEWPLIKKAGTAFTMAGQALKVFRTFMEEPIRSLADSVDDFVRPSYFGGRTEIFKPHFWGDKNNTLSYWDVNSLYPTVMLNEFPTNFRTSTDHYYPDKMGFYDAMVEVPEDMYIPPLGTMLEIDGTKKFIFPVGKFQGRWSTIELEYARSLGVKILWTGQGMIFNNGGPIFKNYIESLYKIRETSPKESVDNVLAKTLMNSCYGRMGLRRDREQVVFDSGQEGFKLISEFPYKYDKESVVRIGSVPKQLDSAFSNVAIAAWVTSLARIHMHKIYMSCLDDIYYTDTDSLFKTGSMFKESKELGGLKLEYQCDSAYFLLPKTYIFRTIDRVIKNIDDTGSMTMEDLKVVAKGISRRDTRGLTLNHFHEGFEGELSLMRMRAKPEGVVSFKKEMKKVGAHLLRVNVKGMGIDTFRTAAKKGSFLHKREDTVKDIKSLYDKRRIIQTSKGYDTEPLVIRDNAVVNMDYKALNLVTRVKRHYDEVRI